MEYKEIPRQEIALVAKLNSTISEGNRKEEDICGTFVFTAGYLAVRKAWPLFAVNLKRIMKLLNEKSKK
ncbi:hypothetical protein [Psychrobacillus sp. FJAT-51614]|uniref:hypothetical protein n=1 Tax=Psychrobacillus mangrovi TaxID=3117745 RepID=UPI0030140BB6